MIGGLPVAHYSFFFFSSVVYLHFVFFNDVISFFFDALSSSDIFFWIDEKFYFI